MRTRIIIVSSGAEDGEFARHLSQRLAGLGFRIWSIETHVAVGANLIQEINTALHDAVAMIVIKSHRTLENDLSSIQQYAFQIQLRLGSTLKLIVIPRGSLILEPALSAQAVVLRPDLDVIAASDMCSLIISRNGQHGSFSTAHFPDGPSVPLLRPGAWSQVPDLSETYSKYVMTVKSLTDLGEYEQARELYWKILYYSGYREHWQERIELSRILLRESLRVRDRLTSGLILSKGIAYVFMTRGQISWALGPLNNAFEEFTKIGDSRGQGICWNYLADIHAASGHIKAAVQAYDQAIQLLEGFEQYQAFLKRELLVCISRDLNTHDRVSHLRSLREEFGAIADYREALVDMHIARGLVDIGDPTEALFHATRAVRLLQTVIIMPRNAKRATQLLNSIEQSASANTSV